MLVVLVIFLSLTSAPPPMPSVEFGDKIGHLLAYGTLTGWFGQLYTRFRTQLWIFVGFCLMGVVLEYLQGLGPARYFEYADMAANSTGAALGWWLTRTWLAGALLKFENKLLWKSAG
ncbi:MAG TPA: VanZ family protein [Gammaproteobacteria bacterium]